MPVRPAFRLSQDATSLTVVVRAPYVRASECELSLEDDTIHFFCSPYLLRLSLPGAINADEETADVKYDPDLDKGSFVIRVLKQHAGETFPDLDLLTTLTLNGAAGRRGPVPMAAVDLPAPSATLTARRPAGSDEDAAADEEEAEAAAAEEAALAAKLDSALRLHGSDPTGMAGLPMPPSARGRPAGAPLIEVVDAVEFDDGHHHDAAAGADGRAGAAATAAGGTKPVAGGSPPPPRSLLDFPLPVSSYAAESAGITQSATATAAGGAATAAAAAAPPSADGGGSLLLRGALSGAGGGGGGGCGRPWCYGFNRLHGPGMFRDLAGDVVPFLLQIKDPEATPAVTGTAAGGGALGGLAGVAAAAAAVGAAAGAGGGAASGIVLGRAAVREAVEDAEQFDADRYTGDAAWGAEDPLYGEAVALVPWWITWAMKATGSTTVTAAATPAATAAGTGDAAASASAAAAAGAGGAAGGEWSWTEEEAGELASGLRYQELLVDDVLYAPGVKRSGTGTGAGAAAVLASATDAGGCGGGVATPDEATHPEHARALAGLFTLLVAYAYDHRLSGGEHSVESGRTISALSPLTSWLDDDFRPGLNSNVASASASGGEGGAGAAAAVPSALLVIAPTPAAASPAAAAPAAAIAGAVAGAPLDVYRAAVRASIRRVVCQGYMRRWDLALLCCSDAVTMLMGGVRPVLKALLQVRRIFAHDEQRYLHNTLWCDQYALWVQALATTKTAGGGSGSSEWLLVAAGAALGAHVGSMTRAEVSPVWGLEALERAALAEEGDDEEEEEGEEEEGEEGDDSDDEEDVSSSDGEYTNGTRTSSDDDDDDDDDDEEEDTSSSDDDSEEEQTSGSARAATQMLSTAGASGSPAAPRPLITVVASADEDGDNPAGGGGAAGGGRGADKL